MKKLTIVLIGIAVVILGLYVTVSIGQHRSFDAEYPVKEMVVSATPEMIEHGRYLVYGPAHCAHCHSSIENFQALEAGEEVAMTGGFQFALPIGTIVTPNITPDTETGIGRYTDGELYRMLRHNIRPDGQACIDFMPFFNMSEHDIQCVIAFLRSRPAVKKENHESEYNFIGKMIRTFALKPSVPNAQITEYIEVDSTVEYGQYLSESVANCRGCHTERDLKTGEFIGEPYAGGFTFGPDASTNNWTFTTPNITPDPTSGVMSQFDRQQFINRMRGGRVHQYSPMPWGPFSRLSDNDLIAIYKFLQTVKPVVRVNGPAATPPETGA